MKMNNAALFFPHEEGDDLFELYEERLFEDKQFFTTKPIIPSIFKKRFQKMMQREKAFRSLTDSKTVATQNTQVTMNAASLPDAYSEYQAKKALILRSLYITQTVTELIHEVESLIELQEVYSNFWVLEGDFSAENILISKETDPSAMAKAVKSFIEAGGKNSADLQQLTYIGKETLLHEAKRLSLWRKKEIEHVRL